MSQADKLRRGSTRALDEPSEPMTPEAVKYEEEQRALLEKSAAEARAFLAQQRVDERSAPVPPTPAADTGEREQHRAALEAKLSNLAEQIQTAKVNKATAEQAEKLAAEQRERDAKLLAAEKSLLESEAAALQREMQRLDAIALAEQAGRDQAARQPVQLQGDAWREQLTSDLEPMVTTAVSALVKLKDLAATHGKTLDTIAALVPSQTLPPEAWRQYSDVINRALAIRKDLAQGIKHTQAVLDRAAAFQPAGFSYAVESQCHALQLALEEVSGVVIAPNAFRDGRSFKQITRTLPDVPHAVIYHRDRIDSLLGSYRTVQERVNASTVKPAAKDVVIVLDKDPSWERRRQLKKAAALTPNPDDGRQRQATGVPEDM
jgi:hypothetical protein